MSSVFIESLLGQMTLEEKIGQMIQIHSSTYQQIIGSESDETTLTGPWGDITYDQKDMWLVGSMLTLTDRQELVALQKTYLEKSRLGIPLLFMFDIIHGYKTIFPITLGQSASWDTDLMEATTRVASVEGSIAGQHVSFSPMADLVRDPRWGRVMESPGEDPYLIQEMVAATVRGFQGPSFDSPYTMAACTKHFAAYGAVEGGRDYNTVDISERWLKEYYLPGYKAAIDAGSSMVMTSFNFYQGIPATINHHLMVDILRDDLAFDGVLISDWDAAKEAVIHGACENDYDSCIKSIDAGLDIEMTSHIYNQNLKKAVENGHIPVANIDASVRRILDLKEALGLFENPFRYANEADEAELTLCDSHRSLAKEAAIKSSVLLKNDGTLPFSKTISTVAVIGPHASNQEVNGWWFAVGNTNDTIALDQGLKNLLGENVRVLSHTGCDFNSKDTSKFEEALKIANEADIIILALGEHYTMSGEAHNRTDITLPGMQKSLAESVLALNKPTATVLYTGRPLDLSWMDVHMPAILNAWFPGTEGGNAVAELLFGDALPSGKVTMSFPRSVGQIPVYYNHFNTGRPSMSQPYTDGDIYDNKDPYGSNYLDLPNTPLYPFGYGLSYTQFDYTNFKLSSDSMTLDKPLIAEVTISNTGTYDGDEIVQLYIRDLAGSVVRPLKELKGYRKVSLQAGASITVQFEIKEEMLRFHTADMTYKSEKGGFEAQVGPNSRDTMSLPFTLV